MERILSIRFSRKRKWRAKKENGSSILQKRNGDRKIINQNNVPISDETGMARKF
jgi:hypothetical protein